jgi:hypothetical protein
VITIRFAALFLAVSALAFAAAPSCNLVPGWTQNGPARTFAPDNLFEYMDGNAEGYVMYGFVQMQGVTCQKGQVSFVIDISDFGDVDSAFGMYSANRDLRQPQLKIGTEGQVSTRRAIFTKGKYYAEIATSPEGDYTADLKQWTAALEKTLDGASEPPAALRWFPAEKQQSLRLVPTSVLGLRLLKRGYVGIYDYGKVFVVLEESPASATAVMQKLRARFGETTSVQIEDEAFVATDKYLGRLCVSRKGRFILGYTNVSEGMDPAALAKSLAGNVR